MSEATADTRQEHPDPSREAQSLRFTRKVFDITQEQLAKKAGLTRASVANIEAGRQRLTPSTFERLTKALDELAKQRQYRGNPQREKMAIQRLNSLAELMGIAVEPSAPPDPAKENAELRQRVAELEAVTRDLRELVDTLRNLYEVETKAAVLHGRAEELQDKLNPEREEPKD